MNNYNDLGLMEQGYLRLNSVLELIPVGRSTWYKWVQCGIAPKPTKLSIRASAWKVEEIKELLSEIGSPDWEKKIKAQMK